MKKRYAILLVLTFFTQCFTALPALANNSGWTVTYYGETFASEENRDLYKAEPNAKSVFDGSKSVLIQCQTPEVIDGNKIELKTQLVSNPTTGKYILKFNVRTTTVFDGEVILGDTVLKISEDMTVTSVVPESGAKNWKEYSVEFDYTEKADADFRLVFYNNIKAAYIDNIILTESESEDNLISDYSFEEDLSTEGSFTPPPRDPEEDIADTSVYQPTNILSSGYNGGVMLTWRNPLSATLTDIKIYDITSGKEILLSEDVPALFSKFVYYKADCDGGNNYQYKIVFSFSDVEDRVYYLTDIPVDAGAKKWGNWSLREYMGGSAGYCPADVYIDSTTGYESDSSLKIVSNIDRDKTEFKSNIFALAQNELAMTAGKKYSISFWVKGENVIRNPQAHMNFVAFDNATTAIPETVGTYDWSYKEYVYTCSSQRTFSLIIDGLCDALWFDNFECYEIDEEGNRVTGQNLFKDGDFENIITKNEVIFEDFSAEAGVGSVKLSFTKPYSNYGGAKLYQLKSGNYEYRGIISSEFDEFEISGLKEFAEYSFKIVPFSSQRYDGRAEEFTVTTLLRDFHITEPVVYKGVNEVTELSGAGTYKVLTTAKNNNVDGNFEYVQMACIYEGNTLVKIYSDKQSVPKTKLGGPYTSTETEFEVPEGDEYNVRIYVIKSKTNPQRYHKLYLN